MVEALGEVMIEAIVEVVVEALVEEVVVDETVVERLEGEAYFDGRVELGCGSLEALGVVDVKGLFVDKAEKGSHNSI